MGLLDKKKIKKTKDENIENTKDTTTEISKKEKYDPNDDKYRETGILSTILAPKKERAKVSELISPKFWNKKLEEYKFNRRKEKDDINVYQILSAGAKPSIEYYVLTIFSSIVATAGLIQGSTAVIIGAMIIAPLMSPILASSLGVIWGDLKLLKISITSVIKGMFWAILIPTIIAFIIPISVFSNEIISRTKPSLFDIVIAIASGCIGAYGYANKRISNTLIGIAIAVALMPPLCTIGIGLGTMNTSIVIGATLLFLINLVSISFSGAVVFYLMKIHPLNAEKSDVRKRAISQIILSLVILIAIATPIVLYTTETYRLQHTLENTRNTIENSFYHSRVFELTTLRSQKQYKIKMTLFVEKIPEQSIIEEIEKKLIKENPIIEDIEFTILQSTFIK